MAELPAWSGAVGSTLVKSADAFLQGMMGPSFEDERAAREEARLKAEAERKRIESQTKLYEAEALYNARRAGEKPARNRQVIQDKAGNWYEVQPEGGPPSKILDAPNVAAKESEMLGLLRDYYASLEPGGAPFPPEKRARLNMGYWALLRNPTESGKPPTAPWDYPATSDPTARLPLPTGAPQPGAPPAAQPGAPPAAQPGAKEGPTPVAMTGKSGAVFLGKPTPEMEGAIAEAHRLYPQVRPELIRAVIARESSYNPYVRSPKGAEGLMQLMPGTSKEMGVEDPFDVKQNVIGGTRYLAQQLARYGGSEAMALAAYNAGPGRFDTGGRDLTKMPPETQTYVLWVLARAGTPTAPQATGGTATPTTPPSALPPPKPLEKGAPGTRVDPAKAAPGYEREQLGQPTTSPEQAAATRKLYGEVGPDGQRKVRSDIFANLPPEEQRLVDAEVEKMKQAEKPAARTTPEDVARTKLVTEGKLPPRVALDALDERQQRLVYERVEADKIAYQQKLTQMKSDEQAARDQRKHEATTAAAMVALDSLEETTKKVFLDTNLAPRLWRASENLWQLWAQDKPEVAFYHDTAIGHSISMVKGLTNTGRMAYAEVQQFIKALPRMFPIPDTPGVANTKLALMRKMLTAAAKRPAGYVAPYDVDDKGGIIPLASAPASAGGGDAVPTVSDEETDALRKSLKP